MPHVANQEMPCASTARARASLLIGEEASGVDALRFGHQQQEMRKRLSEAKAEARAQEAVIFYVALVIHSFGCCLASFHLHHLATGLP